MQLAPLIGRFATLLFAPLVQLVPQWGGQFDRWHPDSACGPLMVQLVLYGAVSILLAQLAPQMVQLVSCCSQCS